MNGEKDDVFVKLEVRDAEIKKILEVGPENELEGYVCYALDLSTGGVVYLYPVERDALVTIAQRAGLDDLVSRLKV